MDLRRRLNSNLVALDDRNRVLAFSDSEDAKAFLAEILRRGPQGWGPQGWRSVTIHHACPYVMADRDKWYAESTPILHYAPAQSSHAQSTRDTDFTSPAQAMT